MCGLHSKIPLCCVFWYTDVWNLDYCERWYNWHSSNTEYILCPNCLTRKMEGKFTGKSPKKCNCDGYVRCVGDPTNGNNIRNDGVIIRNDFISKL